MWLVASSQAQSKLAFEHFHLAEGLPDLNIYSVLQDRQGFIWLGTGNGICRFDGYEFEPVFPAETGLAGGPVSGMMEDEAGNLWICTRGGGVSRYHPVSGQLQTWQKRDSSGLDNDYGNSIRHMPDGSVWLSTDDGIFRANPADEFLTWQRVPLPELPNPAIMDVVQDPWGWVWVATARHGLLRWNPESGVSLHLDAESDDRLSSNLLKGLSLRCSGDSCSLWLAAFRGLQRLAISENGIHDVEFPLNDSPSPDIPKQPRLFGIVAESETEIWAFGYEGLIRIQGTPGQRSVNLYEADAADPASLQGEVVYAALVDDQGVLWVGTESQGMSKSALRATERMREAFDHTRLPEVKGETVQSVTALYENEAGMRLVGLEGGGLQVFDREGNLQQVWTTGTGSRFRLPHAIVTCLLPETDSVFWVGTFGGLAKIDLRTGGSTFFRHSESRPSITDNHVFSLCRINESLWIGTRGGGLNVLNPETSELKAFRHTEEQPDGLPDDYVWKIVPEGDSALWLCTDGGLARYSLADSSFAVWTHDPSRPGTLSHRFLNSVLISSRGDVWVGTAGGGVCLLENGTQAESVRAFRVRDGLPSDYIYELLEDRDGRLWVSTTNGLASFRPDSLGWLSGLRVFSENDGLQGNEFNGGAAFVAPDGSVMMGGLNGYNHVYPDQIPAPESGRPPRLTGVSVLGNPLRPSVCGALPCWQVSGDLPEIRLSHRDYMIEIGFSALNFVDPAATRYAYQLEGVDPDWVYAGITPSATYTNLPTGRHTFRVKILGSEVRESTLLIIDVAPPWWATWWARLLWAVLLVGAVAGIIRFRIHQQLKKIETDNRIRLAREEERERLRKQTARDFHDELGNRMTRISLFSELLRRNAPTGQETTTFLDKIEQNIQALSTGMRDLIWVLDPGKDTLEETVTRLVAFGAELFEHSGIRFSTEISLPDSPVLLPSHTRKNLLLIVQEAMNNALKYSEATEVQFSVTLSGNQLQVTVSDNGRGFDPGSQPPGNGLVNMQERAEVEGASWKLASGIGEGVTIALAIDLDL